MQRFEVTGMSCAACSAHVEKAVAAVPGVSAVSVSLLTNSMQVELRRNARFSITISRSTRSSMISLTR